MIAAMSTSEQRRPFVNDALNLARGMCMGCADVVPGVSGGTVALILGIYQRLVTAVSHVDGSLVGMLRQREWKKCEEHLDLRFLVALGGGVVTGLVGMSLVVNRLLADATSRSMTFSVFSGMILASAFLVIRMIRPVNRQHTIRCTCFGVIGIAFAYWVSTLTAGGSMADPSYAYIFLCGSIAICAMILPGISGALILLVLGIYGHLTEVPHNLLHGEAISDSVVTTVVFGCGCLISLVLFSKVLRWLLANHHSSAMSLLCGFMVGALRKLWPFQHDTTPQVVKFKEKVFQAYLPDQVDGAVLSALVAAILAAGFVFAVHHLAAKHAAAAKP